MKPQTTGYLPTTSISFLANLERSGNDEKLIHLGIFFERYRSGLCKVLAGRANLGPQDAEEIVHEFLVKKLVDGEFISKYLSCLKQSGSAIRKFRPYLVTSIKRFATDYLRSRNRPIPEDLKHNLTIVDDDIGDLFTTEWLQELLAILFQETRRFFVESGRETHWQVFLRRSVEPIVLGSRPPSYEELADQYELESARAANNVWIVVLRKFKRVWGDVLANALQSGEDKEYRETMHELQSCLRMAGYIDMRRLLVNSVLASDSSTSTDSLDTEQFTSIFSLASNGFNEMMPIERELFFSVLSRHLAGRSASGNRSCADLRCSRQ